MELCAEFGPNHGCDCAELEGSLDFLAGPDADGLAESLVYQRLCSSCHLAKNSAGLVSRLVFPTSDLQDMAYRLIKKF